MIRKNPNAARKPAQALALTGLVMLLAAASAGCMRKGETTGSIAPADLRDRHPIVLRDAPKTLDVFVGRAGTGLDDRQSDDVAAFGAGYRKSGRGALMAQIPSGTGRDRAASQTMAAVRSVLARNGVSAVNISTYHPADPTLAAPIRLTYATLQAQVPNQCGIWDEDAGVSSFKQDAENAPMRNFGCSYQTNLAAQIADPLDLVRGRQEGRIDTVKRMGAIDKLREGKDPSTEYRQEATKINNAVGSN